MPRDASAFAWDALQACALLEESTDGVSFAEYERGALLRSAVERQLEIIGEALNRIARDAPSLAALSRTASNRRLPEPPGARVRQRRQFFGRQVLTIGWPLAMALRQVVSQPRDD